MKINIVVNNYMNRIKPLPKQKNEKNHVTHLNQLRS